MTEQLLHQIDVHASLIDALRKTFRQTVCGEFAVQFRRLKHFLKHLVYGLSIHGADPFLFRERNKGRGGAIVL